MEISITLQNTFNQTSIFFQKLVLFPRIDQSKGRLVKRQLKMLGMVQKRKLYRTILIHVAVWGLSFYSFISHLIGRETINIPEIFSGVLETKVKKLRKT